MDHRPDFDTLAVHAANETTVLILAGCVCKGEWCGFTGTLDAQGNGSWVGYDLPVPTLGQKTVFGQVL
jgi:hypothetical protein